MRQEATLLHELVQAAADREPQSVALHDDARVIRYDELAGEMWRFAAALSALGLGPRERVAVYLDKRVETFLVDLSPAWLTELTTRF